MLNCPHCNQAHDISSRIAGDRVWCPRCANWLMLAFHRDGAAYFVKVGPPATYPREKR
jgi:hypothetical protein